MIYPTLSIGFILFGKPAVLYDVSYMTDIDKIRANLAAIITSSDTNPRAVALEAELGHTAVRDILIGKTKSPKISTLEKIAKVLHVQVTDITGDTGKTNLSDQERELLSAWSDIEDWERSYLLDSVIKPAASRGRPD